MKHKKVKLFHLLILLIGIVFICSCSSDSSDDIDNTPSSLIKGTKWTTTDWDFSVGDDWASIYDERFDVYFYSDNMGIFYQGTKIYDSDFGLSRDQFVSFFTYKVDGKRIMVEDVIYGMDFGIYYFEINGNELVANHLTYNKGKIDSSDLSWINSLHGTTGECQWYYNMAGGLVITGEGKMQDYKSFEQTPWSSKYLKPNIVFIDESVTTIGAHAFENPSICNIDLKNTTGAMKEIRDYAFAGSSLSKCILPTGIEMIGTAAFKDCSYLETALPTNTVTVGESAFEGCKKVSLSWTPNIKHIGKYAFLKTKVNSWTDSEVLEDVGEMAFTNCNFSRLTLPNTIKRLENYSFSSSYINHIYIGSELKEIIGTPFDPNYKGQLYINQNSPLELSYNIINSECIRNWDLFVPKGSKSAYSKAPYWRNFKQIYESSELNGDGTDPNGNNNEGDDEYADDFVDLGLSVKWANKNIGATDPEEYGDYFAWGEIATKKSYSKENSLTYGKSLDNISGDIKYDAAKAICKNNSRIPTLDEINELINKCTCIWTTENVVPGIIFVGPNGNKIFLPAGGMFNVTKHQGKDTHGRYWSSTCGKDKNKNTSAFAMFFNDNDPFVMDANRFVGYNIRPVRDK